MTKLKLIAYLIISFILLTPVFGVAPVFNAPVGGYYPHNLNIAEHSVFTFDFKPFFSDPDNDTLTYSILTYNDLITTELNNGVLKINASAHNYGTDGFKFVAVTVSAYDGTNYAYSDPIVLLINNVNDKPELNLSSISLKTNTIKTIDLADYIEDLDNDIVEFDIESSNREISVRWADENDVYDTKLNIIPNPNYVGESSFTVNMSDGKTVSKGTVTVHVLNGGVDFNTNNFPVVINIPEDSNNVSIDVKPFFNNPSNVTLSYGYNPVLSNMTISIGQNGIFTFVPAQNYNGVQQVRFTASFNGSFIPTDYVTLNVTSVNDNPIVVFPTYDIPILDETESFLFNVSISDIDSVPEISWYENNILKQTSGNTLNFNNLVPGEYNITVSVKDYSYTNNKTWTVKVSDKPVTRLLNGQTTNFSNITDLSRATNITLEKQGVGKVYFGSEVLDLTKTVDIDRYVNIQNKLIGIDTNKLPGLRNAKARVTMSGLNFQNTPAIYFSNDYTNNFDSVSTLCTALTNPSCTNVSYSNGVLNFDASHFTTFKAVDPSSLYNITTDVSQATLTQYRNNEFRKEFYIKNTGLETVYNITASLINKYGDLNLTLSKDNYVFNDSVIVDSLAPNTQATIYVKGTVPIYFESGKIKVGELVFSNDKTSSVSTILYVDVPSKLNIKTIDFDVAQDTTAYYASSKLQDVRPNSNITMTVNLAGSSSIDLKEVFYTMEIKSLDIKRTTGKQSLYRTETLEQNVKFTIPMDVQEKTYQLVITAQGKDTSTGAIEYASRTIDIVITKEEYDAIISDIYTFNDYLTCDRNLEMGVSITNIGSSYDDSIKLVLNSPKLGIDKIFTGITLSPDEETTKSMEFSVPENLTAGEYKVDVTIYSDSNKYREKQSIFVTVEDCVKSKVENNTVSTNTGNINPSLINMNNGEVTVSFRESNFYIIALVALIGLLLILVVLVIAVGLFKPKRKRPLNTDNTNTHTAQPYY